MALPAEKKTYTFADCLSWEERDRAEVIDGEVFLMAPPSRVHQEITFELGRQLGNFLEGKPCKVYLAPFAVRLFEEERNPPEEVDTVVEPDLSVVCDPSKLDDIGCQGAPDLIMEILSPSNFRHDLLVKLDLYQRAGVREYWIADPENRTVRVLVLDGEGRFQHREVYSRGEIARVNVLEGCFIDLGKVFPE